MLMSKEVKMTPRAELVAGRLVILPSLNGGTATSCLTVQHRDGIMVYDIGARRLKQISRNLKYIVDLGEPVAWFDPTTVVVEEDRSASWLYLAQSGPAFFIGGGGFPNEGDLVGIDGSYHALDELTLLPAVPKWEIGIQRGESFIKIVEGAASEARA